MDCVCVCSLPVYDAEDDLMITEILLDILIAVIGGLNTLLPDWSIEWPPLFQEVMQWLVQFDELLPVREVFQCMTLGGALLGGMNAFKWGVKVIDWIMDVIP